MEPFLSANGAAVIERPGFARLTVEMCRPTLAAARALKRRLGGTFRHLPPDLPLRWLQSPAAKPLRVGRYLLVVNREAPVVPHPSAPFPGSAFTLHIPAEAAFGTGRHATTAMSLRLLEESARAFPAGWTLLDAGSGSGILALAAKCLGAGSVLGFDHDPVAIKTARRNARRNGIKGVRFVTGDATTWESPARFDVLMANLYSEVLRAALPRLVRHLAPGGLAIFSGLLRAQEAAFVRVLRRAGLRPVTVRRRGKWIALLVHHTAQKRI